MAEINLLPGELRAKEEKEMAAVHKIPRVVKIEMSQPPKEKKPSFFRRFFGRQNKKPPAAFGADKKSPWPKPESKPLAKPNLPPSRSPWPPKPALAANGNQARNFGASGQPPAAPVLAAPNNQGREKLEDALKSLLEEKKPASAAPAFRPPAVEKKAPLPVKPVKNGRNGEKGKKDRPAVFGVNLLAQAFGGTRDLGLGRKFIISGLAGLTAIILVAGVYFGIVIYQNTVQGDISRAKEQVASLDREIAGLEKEKEEALDLQKRLNLIKDLLAKHVYWTDFFRLLEKYTIDEVYYMNFSMAGKDKLVISAVGKDYKSLAKQFLAFEQAKDFIQTVRIDSASADIDAQKGVYKGVKFNINLEFAPDVFLK